MQKRKHRLMLVKSVRRGNRPVATI